MNSTQELERLESIAADSWYARGICPRMTEYTFSVFSRHLRGGRILELGPAEGVMTPMLAKVAAELTIVEGAGVFCEALRKRFPGATVVHSLFEDFEPSGAFDSIILGHVLEHVDDPVALLRLARGWLAPGGRVLAAVPNARSLHRQVGVLLGKLPVENAMNETDRHHGHRRVYDPELFRSHFIEAGFRIEVFGGYWLKPVSNQQIEESWSPELLDACMQLGERYPDIACEIYIVATGR